MHASSHRAAYGTPILVYGIDSDGVVGRQPLNVIATMATEEDTFPCPLPTAGRVCHTALCCVVSTSFVRRNVDQFFTIYFSCCC